MKVGEKLDLITIGRSSVDLYGQQTGGRLEDMSSFAKTVGGCPANIAIGTARLGLKSALLTRVGNDHMGRYISEQMVREGVSVDGVITDPDRLTALVVLGVRDQDSFPLIFYRENCADMALDEDDVDKAFIQSSRSVLVTGTHLSTAGTKRASKKAISFAREVGRKVIFDVDYRPVLWGLVSKDMGEDRFVADAGVTAELQMILPDCDLVVGTEEELHILGGCENTIEAIKIVRKHTKAVIVCKRGPKGCTVFDKAIPDSLEDGIHSESVEIEVFNVLGAGDAFMSGFLAGWLRDLPLEECCRYGNICGAIVVSRLACSAASPTLKELQHFLTNGSSEKALRKDKQLEHIHWATTRAKDYDNIKILAIDHRSQFLDMTDALDVDPARIPAFKPFALKAVDNIAKGDPSFGILFDGRFGMRGLELAADKAYWIGRPIELPGSRPLEFECSADVATEIREWPANHVVKCLVFYHPDDEQSLKERQERQLMRVADACRKTGHEFLLEIISSKHGAIDVNTVAQCIERMYNIGVYPDWWKLEPAADKETWDNIEKAIRDNDPLCRGIVMLGLSAPEEELLNSFKVASGCSLVKGFAVGRTIFNDAARKWFAGEITDDEAVAMLEKNFSTLIKGWNAARNISE